MKRISIIMGLLLAAVSAFSQNAWEFETELIDGNVIITGYTGSEKYVHIPEKIYKMTVVAIGEYAFAEKQLTGVSIPYGVTAIGDGAFYGNRIKGVVIPSSVTSIGAAAFSNNEIKNVAVPGTVTSIGESAFANNCIKNVFTPSSIASVGGYDFSENKDSYELTFF